MPAKGTKAGDAITAIARRLVSLHPDAPARTLARRLVAESNKAITIDQAYMRIRRVLGVHGKKNRVKAAETSLYRQPRQAGEAYAMPASVAEPWTPYRLEVVGRVGIMSDVHVPYHSELAVSAAVAYLERQDLAGLLLNGDIADFYAISRYQKDPKQRDFKAELTAVREFLGWLRSRFPDIPIVYKMGNHEERWTHWIWQHAAEISDDPRMSLSAWLELDRHGIDIVDDQRIVMLGKLPVLHGHELPRGMAAPVNPARGVFMRTLSTGLIGHQHRSSNHAESDLFHRETACWSTGCLCDLTPEYSRINRWNWGFAVATVHKDKTFDVQNLRVMLDGTVRTS